MNSDEVINQLKYTFLIDQVRVLENITENGLTYNPIILQVDSARYW